MHLAFTRQTCLAGNHMKGVCSALIMQVLFYVQSKLQMSSPLDYELLLFAGHSNQLHQRSQCSLDGDDILLQLIHVWLHGHELRHPHLLQQPAGQCHNGGFVLSRSLTPFLCCF